MCVAEWFDPTWHVPQGTCQSLALNISKNGAVVKALVMLLKTRGASVKKGKSRTKDLHQYSEIFFDEYLCPRFTHQNQTLITQLGLSPLSNIKWHLLVWSTRLTKYLTETGWEPLSWRSLVVLKKIKKKKKLEFGHVIYPDSRGYRGRGCASSLTLVKIWLESTWLILSLHSWHGVSLNCLSYITHYSLLIRCSHSIHFYSM